MNFKRKSRRRLFLLMRSRTPPISSEFRGGLNTPNPPSRYATGELHHIIAEVSKTTIHEAVIENLGYRKLCARWVPKMLTITKLKRMGSELKFLTRYAQEGDEFLESIVTGNEIWVFSPHSWIQATVTAMAPYAFPQNQKIQNFNFGEKKHGVLFLGEKRHPPGRLHASWRNN